MEDKTQPKATARPAPAATGTGHPVPEDRELAAIADKAGAPLRKERKPTQETPKAEMPAAAAPAAAPARAERKPTQETPKAETPAAAAPAAAPAREAEGYLDEDGDLVELPLERSVRAFVASISPSVPLPAPPDTGRGNGESLDTALDAFVRDAKAWSASLPAPAIDDRSLAELAKVPVDEPPPKQPEPPPPMTVAVVQPAPPPPPQRSLVMPIALAFVLGGAAVFGGLKLLGFGQQPPPPPAVDPAAVQEPAEPETKTSPVAAPLATDGGPAVAAESRDAGASAAAQADAGTAAPATQATAGPGETPTPGETPGAVTPPPPKVAKVGAKRRGKGRRGGVAVKRLPKPPKPPKPKAAAPKGKKPSSDWVDPFSQ